VCKSLAVNKGSICHLVGRSFLTGFLTSGAHTNLHQLMLTRQPEGGEPMDQRRSSHAEAVGRMSRHRQGADGASSKPSAELYLNTENAVAVAYPEE
jgi:hypothetical protein